MSLSCNFQLREKRKRWSTGVKDLLSLADKFKCQILTAEEFARTGKL